MDFTQVKDSVKYDWTEQLAKDFFYEKCHGHPEDIVKELENLIDDVVDAVKELQND